MLSRNERKNVRFSHYIANSETSDVFGRPIQYIKSLSLEKLSDFQGHLVKCLKVTKRTRQIVNHWMDLNQNIQNTNCSWKTNWSCLPGHSLAGQRWLRRLSIYDRSCLSVSLCVSNFTWNYWSDLHNSLTGCISGQRKLSLNFWSRSHVHQDVGIF